MASRQMKMPIKDDAEKSLEAEDVLSQRRRPELGRYLLQVDMPLNRRLWRSRRVIRSSRCRCTTPSKIPTGSWKHRPRRST
jgi:hypothetical protein